MMQSEQANKRTTKAARQACSESAPASGSADAWQKQYAKPGFAIYARADGAEIYGGGHVWVTTRPGPIFHRTLKAAKACSDQHPPNAKISDLHQPDSTQWKK